MTLATRLILEEALEAEARDALGRDYFERGAEEGLGYRNGRRLVRHKTGEGAIKFSTAQIAGRDEPFRSEIRQHAKGRTEALEELAVEMLARGPVGARYRGRLPRQRRRAVAVAHRRVRTGRAALAGLPGLCHAGSEQTRDRLPIPRRHRRAHPPQPAAQTGHGRLGLHRDRPARFAAPDGGI